jgi:UPF0716 protein FxsA
LIGVGLLLVPVLEIAVAIQVGARIGVMPTILLLVAGSLAGLAVLRRVGTAAVRRLTTAAGSQLETGPRRPPAQSAVAVLAGLLLAFPGFLTDLAGLLLLIPAVQRGVVRRAGDALVSRVPGGGVRIVQGQVITNGTAESADQQVRVEVIQSSPTPPPHPIPPALPGPQGPTS